MFYSKQITGIIVYYNHAYSNRISICEENLPGKMSRETVNASEVVGYQDFFFFFCFFGIYKNALEKIFLRVISETNLMNGEVDGNSIGAIVSFSCKLQYVLFCLALSRLKFLVFGLLI